MHVHCSECSACATSSSKEMVRGYKDAGYQGFVLTDHFLYGNTRVPKNIPYEEQMKMFYDAYLSAKEEGDKLDFDVLFGIEHHYGSGKELLFYGIDLDFLLSNPDIPYLNPYEFSERVREYGGFVVMAHPFRDRPYIDMSVKPIPEILDGAEIYNAGNPEEDNIKAKVFASVHGLTMISGSDCHSVNAGNFAKGGIIVPFRIKTNEQLVSALKNGHTTPIEP